MDVSPRHPWYLVYIDQRFQVVPSDVEVFDSNIVVVCAWKSSHIVFWFSYRVIVVIESAVA